MGLSFLMGKDFLVSNLPTRYCNLMPRRQRPATPKHQFFPQLVAAYLVSVFVTMPFVTVLHRMAEDVRQLENCQQCAAPGGKPLPAQRQHDQSQCITCQLLASSQKHGLLLPASSELPLNLSPISAAAAPVPICSLDHTSAALARGPPPLA